MITLGSNSTLSLTIPSPGESNWANAIRTGCFQKIVDHNHQGLAGTGSKLSGYLALDLTVATLTNNTWFLARNSGNSANVKIFKLYSNNVDIYIGEDTASVTSSRIGKLIMKSGTYVQSVNVADNGFINIIKTNASDRVELGDEGAANVSLISGYELSVTGLKNLSSSTSLTLADNQAVAADTGITSALSGSDTIIVEYKIVRNSLIQKGTLTADYTNGNLIHEYAGTNVGLTFSFSSGLIKYTSTSTGHELQVKYFTRRI